MADQVNASLHAQRNLAAQNARLAERSRISRELHDSISQDLFSQFIRAIFMVCLDQMVQAKQP